MTNNKYETIRHARSDYRAQANQPWIAFNWTSLVDASPVGLHLVTFSMSLNQDASNEQIEELKRYDAKASLEAEDSTGFLCYYADEISVGRTALSFCIWESAEDAKAASSRPDHLAAVEYARNEGQKIYLNYVVRRYLLEQSEERQELQFWQYGENEELFLAGVA